MNPVTEAVKGKYPSYRNVPDDKLTLAIGQKYPIYLKNNAAFNADYNGIIASQEEIQRQAGQTVRAALREPGGRPTREEQPNLLGQMMSPIATAGEKVFETGLRTGAYGMEVMANALEIAELRPAASSVRGAAKSWKEEADQQAKAERQWSGRYGNPEGFERKLAVGAFQVVGQIGMVLGSRGAANPMTIGMGTAGVQTFGGTMSAAESENFRRIKESDPGLSDEDARNMARSLEGAYLPAVMDGVAALALTKIINPWGGGIESIGKEKAREVITAGFKGVAKDFGKGFFSEGLEEGAQSLSSSVIAKMYYNPDLTLKEAIASAGEEALIGGILGGGFTAGSTALQQREAKRRGRTLTDEDFELGDEPVKADQTVDLGRGERMPGREIGGRRFWRGARLEEGQKRIEGGPAAIEDTGPKPAQVDEPLGIEGPPAPAPQQKGPPIVEAEIVSETQKMVGEEAGKVAGAMPVYVAGGRTAFSESANSTDEIEVDLERLDAVTKGMNKNQRRAYIHGALHEGVVHNATFQSMHSQWEQDQAGKPEGDRITFAQHVDNEAAGIVNEMTEVQKAAVRKIYGQDQMSNTEMAMEYTRILMQRRAGSKVTEETWAEVHNELGLLDTNVTRNWLRRAIDWMRGREGSNLEKTINRAEAALKKLEKAAPKKPATLAEATAYFKENDPDILTGYYKMSQELIGDERASEGYERAVVAAYNHLQKNDTLKDFKPKQFIGYGKKETRKEKKRRETVIPTEDVPETAATTVEPGLEEARAKVREPFERAANEMFPDNPELAADMVDVVDGTQKAADVARKHKKNTSTLSNKKQKLIKKAKAYVRKEGFDKTQSVGAAEPSKKRMKKSKADLAGEGRTAIRKAIEGGKPKEEAVQEWVDSLTDVEYATYRGLAEPEVTETATEGGVVETEGEPTGYINKTYEAAIKWAQEKFDGKEDPNYEPIKDQWIAEKDIATAKADAEAVGFLKRIADTIPESARKVGDLLHKKRREVHEINRAILIYIDSKRNPGHIDEFYDDLTPEQQALVDRSKNLTPEQKEIANEISKSFNEVGLMAKDSGIIKNTLENYVARTWNLEEEGKFDSFMQKFGLKTGRSKKRTFETIIEGMAAGYDLKVDTVTQSLFNLKVELARVIENQKLIKAGKKAGVFSSTRESGWEPITNPGFYSWEVSSETIEELRKEHREFEELGGFRTFGKNFFVTEEGVIMERRILYAPKDVAKDLNAILGKSALQGMGGALGRTIDALTIFNAYAKAIVLSTGFFHHQAYGRSYLLGGATEQKGAKYNPVTAMKEGREAYEQMTPEVQLLIRAGLTVGRMQDVDSVVLAKKTALGKLLDKNGVVGPLKNWALEAQERQMRWLFQRLGGGLKVNAALLEYRHFLQQHPEMDALTRAKEVAQLINEDFGGLHRERTGHTFFRSPTAQHLGRLALLAPDWTESNIRTMLKVTGGIRGDAAIRKVRRQLYRRFWKRIAMKGLGATLFGNIALALLYGPDDEDTLETLAKNLKKARDHGKLRWLEVDITPVYESLGVEGVDAYGSILGHFRDPIKFLPKDLAFSDTIRSAKHKGSIISKMALEMVTGSDWRNAPFTTTEEFLGLDDKGKYETTKKNRDFDPTKPESEENPRYHWREGDPKGGKLKGKLTKWGGKQEPGAGPSYWMAQGRGLLPIAAQQIWTGMAGESDWVTATAKGLGLMVSVGRREGEETQDPRERRIAELRAVGTNKSRMKREKVLDFADAHEGQTWAQAGADARKEAGGNRDLLQAMKAEMMGRSAGLTPDDNDLRSLPSEQRATFILEELEGMTGGEERLEYYRALHRKKIITEKVDQQMSLQSGKTIKRILGPR